MTYPPAPTYRPAVPGSMIAVRLVVALISLPLAAIEFFMGGFAIMATDSCYSGSTDFVCTGLGTLLVMSPLAGGFLLAVGCVALAALCTMRRNGLWWILFGAFWGVAIMTFAIAAFVSP